MDKKDLDTIKKEVEGFACLPQGWSSYDDHPISKDAIKRSIDIIKCIGNNANKVTVYPSIIGGVLISVFYEKDIWLEIEINKKGEIELWEETDNDIIEDDGSFFDKYGLGMYKEYHIEPE